MLPDPVIKFPPPSGWPAVNQDAILERASSRLPGEHTAWFYFSSMGCHSLKSCVGSPSSPFFLTLECLRAQSLYRLLMHAASPSNHILCDSSRYQLETGASKNCVSYLASLELHLHKLACFLSVCFGILWSELWIFQPVTPLSYIQFISWFPG